jgi:hypothetical protein
MELLLVVILVLLFDYVAIRWGYDSRDGFRSKNR